MTRAASVPAPPPRLYGFRTGLSRSSSLKPFTISASSDNPRSASRSSTPTKYAPFCGRQKTAAQNHGIVEFDFQGRSGRHADGQFQPQAAPGGILYDSHVAGVALAHDRN